MDKKYILFDLDGTLTDPKEGITKSVEYVLNSHGILVDDLDKLCPFIGPPLQEGFMEFYGFPQDKAREAVFKYREYFSVKGWKENKKYEGIDKVLLSLKNQGKLLFVATSKPENMAVKILDYFGLSSFFEFIGGADMEETRVKKADVIRYVLETTGITDVSQAVMIGDREHDIIGAREVGMASVGVLYGYGSRKELEEAGADYIAENLEQLAGLF